MEQNIAHHHTILGWINHHFMEISMVWFPAFLGYLNATVASLKVMGFTRASEFLGKLEDGIKTFVDTVKTQKQGVQNEKVDSSVSINNASGTGTGTNSTK